MTIWEWLSTPPYTEREMRIGDRIGEVILLVCAITLVMAMFLG